MIVELVLQLKLVSLINSVPQNNVCCNHVLVESNTRLGDVAFIWHMYKVLVFK